MRKARIIGLHQRRSKHAPAAAAFRFPSANRCDYFDVMLSHDLDLFIGFEDADPAGVVFYPRAIALAHRAVEEMIRRSDIGWDAWFASPVHAIPVRQATADFLLPMRPGEKVTARASVEALGDTSVTFKVEFHARGGELAAVVRTVHVLVDKATGRPMPLPAAMRNALG